MCFPRLGLETGFSFSGPGLWPWGFQGAEMVILRSCFFARDPFPRQARGKGQNVQNGKLGYLRTFSSTSTVERARLSSKLEFWTPWASKGCPFRKLLGVLWGPLRLPLPSACRGKGYFGTFWECLNSFSSLPVKEKAISGSGREASERPFSDDPEL